MNVLTRSWLQGSKLCKTYYLIIYTLKCTDVTRTPCTRARINKQLEVFVLVVNSAKVFRTRTIGRLVERKDEIKNKPIRFGSALVWRNIHTPRPQRTNHIKVKNNILINVSWHSIAYRLMASNDLTPPAASTLGTVRSRKRSTCQKSCVPAWKVIIF